MLSGTSPLAGALVQVYAAGTAGNGSSGTALLSAPVLTDGTGSFSIVAGSYDCPAAGSVLYLLAQGGAPAGASGTGADTLLLTVPGTCGSAVSPLTVNEVTTVAGAYALHQFLGVGGQVGASATNVGGLTLAQGTMASLVNLATGVATGTGFPANGTAPAARLNTVANALHGCTAADAASATACAGLFSATTLNGTTPANTLGAVLNLVSSPGANVAALFALSTANPAFSPALGAAPPDWMLWIPFTGGGMDGPAVVSIDSGGRVWVASYPEQRYTGSVSLFTNLGAAVFPNGITGYGIEECYGGAVDAHDNFWVANQESDYTINSGFGSITVLGVTGSTLTTTVQYGAGGLSNPQAISFDATGVAWIVNYGNSYVTLLDPNGVPLSGATGYTTKSLDFPGSVAVDSKRNGWIGNTASASMTELEPDGSSPNAIVVGDDIVSVVVDGADNVWTADYLDNAVGLISPAGKVLSGPGFTGGGLLYPAALAIDGAGTVWMTNLITPMNQTGASVSELAGAAAAQPGAAISPATGWVPDAGMQRPRALAIDASGNVWVVSSGNSTLLELVGAAVPVKTPALGPVRVP